MDALIVAAARALARGDPIHALKLVALREDASALALRGIAMAQLGELARGRDLLRAAMLAFGPRERLSRARCVLAETEIALAMRELGGASARLEGARRTLAAQGDATNAAHAGYLQVRHALLTGHIAEAQRLLDGMPRARPLALHVVHELLTAHVAMRRLQTGAADAALARASRLCTQAGMPALRAEIDRAVAQLEAPAARLVSSRGSRELPLREVEKLLRSRALIVDVLRHAVRRGDASVGLTSRPVLLALVRAVAKAWPGDVTRDELVQRAFRLRRADDSSRARLRVEVGRLRQALRGIAHIEATARGFALQPLQARRVLVLDPLVDTPHGAVLAVLADGEAWSSSALALALRASQRTVQRALDELARTQCVSAIGRGRSRRWTRTSAPAFTTLLLLPSTLPAP